LTVIRDCGHVSCADTIAARTRSRASCTDASGNPTIVNVGNPEVIDTSTSTR